MYEKFKEILNTLTESDLDEWLEFDKKRLLESNIIEENQNAKVRVNNKK